MTGRGLARCAFFFPPYQFFTLFFSLFFRFLQMSTRTSTLIRYQCSRVYIYVHARAAAYYIAIGETTSDEEEEEDEVIYQFTFHQSWAVDGTPGHASITGGGRLHTIYNIIYIYIYIYILFGREHL
jgi:hypothetical protein